ncbi:hypothetical protein V6N13_093009 [Hibiscus sabdariffa]|uniref:CCHC-type domain-containing protein n=1 Tax=Hibiscus sabdariffa TaxID=183260 RepID=A0ABR2AA05_9ROSI
MGTNSSNGTNSFPVQMRPPSRPKKQRKKEKGLEIKCIKCGKVGHNIRTCKGRVRSNVRHNIPLVATPVASAPLTPPGSPHLSLPVLAPPATTPPFPAPPTTTPSTSAPQQLIDQQTSL